MREFLLTRSPMQWAVATICIALMAVNCVFEVHIGHPLQAVGDTIVNSGIFCFGAWLAYNR